MPDYTSILRRSIDAISMEDDNFIEELLGVAQLFRPFWEAMDEFISGRGYAGDPGDTEAKVRFIREAFERAGMKPPREIRRWYEGQPVRRETAFRICFAFSLEGLETDEFFRCVFAKERSFDCHRLNEAVYYFCLNHGRSYGEAQSILREIPASEGKEDGETVYTDSILARLNGIESREELVSYLTENRGKFFRNNVTAYETIRRLWERAAGPEGLLVRERARFMSSPDEAVSGRRTAMRTNQAGVQTWDAVLAIFQMERRQARRLGKDRSLKPILEKLHADAGDSFPDRQGIEKILRGEPVSYERVRKWIGLLTFYAFWASKALACGSYAAGELDAERCAASMNRHITEAGYPELYVGNPYDWIFLFAAKDEEPLVLFREIWKSLLGLALEETPEKPAGIPAGV